MDGANPDIARQLRQIKWLLLAIFVCLVAILLALTPGLLQLLGFLAVAAVAGGLVALAWLVGRERWQALFARFGRSRRG